VQIVHTGGQVGWYSSLGLLPNGDPCILSWDIGHGIVDYDWFSAGAWSRDEIETMGWTDQWCSLALDEVGRPYAAYRSATEQDLHHAVASDPAAAPEAMLSDPLAALCAFPNPARRGESIRLAQSMPASARLRIFDPLGREVADPIALTASGTGSGAVHWVVPPAFPAGVYLLRAETAELERNGRLIIVR
jgi:hypothetical protein